MAIYMKGRNGIQNSSYFLYENKSTMSNYQVGIKISVSNYRRSLICLVPTPFKLLTRGFITSSRRHVCVFILDFFIVHFVLVT